MARTQQLPRRHRVFFAVCATVFGAALFILGLDTLEMWLVVLISFYVYWILRMD